MTNEDIDRMVRQVVHSLLNESITEVQGSAMADNEDVIDAIVGFLEREWDRKRQQTAPQWSNTFKDRKTGNLVTVNEYVIQVPATLCTGLGLTDDFELMVQVNNFLLNDEALAKFSYGDRSTNGVTHFGGMYDKFSRTTLKYRHSSVELIVPAVNDELQIRGLYNTLYHELNHLETGRQVKAKHQYLPDDELNDLSIFGASRRAASGERIPHFSVQNAMDPDPLSDMMMDITYGSYRDRFMIVNEIFYSLWEQTERNARAEGMYGDLKYLKPTRENFKDVYKETELCHEIEILRKYLEKLEDTPTTSPAGMSIWFYAAGIMNMKDRDARQKKNSRKSFYEQVKRRFINHSLELIDDMYRHGMKVAELYFERKERREKAGKPMTIHDKINARAGKL